MVVSERAGERRTRWGLGLVAAVIGLFAARFAVIGLIEAWLYALGQMGTMGEYSPSYLGVAARLVLGAGLLGVSGLVVQKVEHDLADGRFRWVAAATAGLAGVAGAWLHHLSHAEFLAQIGAHAAPYSDGTYPFAASSEKVYERFGMRGLARFDGDGFRACGPQAAAGPRVTLAGDSMIFGLILDDADTLCWNLRERFVSRGLDVRWRNAGVPGLSLRSYVENLEAISERFGTEAALVGVLVGNDGQVVDLYTRDRLTRHPLYALAAAVFDPYLPMAVAVAFVKIWRAEGFELVSTVDALRELAAFAERRQVPTLVFFYDDPYSSHAARGAMAAYVREAEALAAAHPYLRFAGVLTVPGDPPGAYAIPDGHPNGRGNAWYADVLAPALAELLEVPWAR